ncbi:N,N-dimethylformamidase beta subunit family domain-containing protein [Actinomadura sp. 7K507]|uniref:N,N-dimethylformamidase beta subunit family domain-containing protein n=1 Tax=Actinomadura sp. 7K507 TaxID=2530365 RepID=UPI0010527F6A|nr:N,N-dimethylformamidase beta subunit family domain-containing protein [Actinomadura sp. 7K507]TDC97591.1 LamG domain-containing protein [Actinomadura sp. 7K507]
MDVVGYSDPICVSPGDKVSLMISSADPEVQVSLVRLRQGDGRPAEPVAGSLDGVYRAGPQPLRRGSYVRVPHDPRLDLGAAFSVVLWAQPTLVGADERALIGKQDGSGMGWSLSMTEDGRVRFTVTGENGADRVETSRRLREGDWHCLIATFDGPGEEISVTVLPVRPWTVASQSVISENAETAARATVTRPAPTQAPLLIAGALARDDSGEHVGSAFNGKLAAPRLFGRALTRAERTAERDRTELSAPPVPAAAWDFAGVIGTRNVLETTGNAPHGRTVQLPTRGVTGPRWDGHGNPAEDPGRYDAIHFHDDDLDDAGWNPTVEWTVDTGLPSGVYAAHVRGSRAGEDYIPIVVRPPRDRATAPVLLVAPLFSWLAYGNVRALEQYGGKGDAPSRYVLDHGLNSTYDTHTDGSGVCYSSWRRPLLNLRPGFHLPILESPHQLSADLLLVDWLHHHGHEVDIVTDADLHHEGAALLDRYQVVLSGTHAEYWSAQMLDALETYQNSGGRYMYLSGNGLYWVTGLDEEEGHTIEVRRQGAAVSAWHCAPGEGHLSTTGEPGGLWRWRGRAPQHYVGVGFSACWSTTPKATGAPYVRGPGSHDPRASWIFEGVSTDEPIGDFPNQVLSYGAAGYEVDRADPSLGTPPHALILATATEFPADHWMPATEELTNPNLRADMVFFETPSGGAVFSTGSITWCSALSYDNYANNVSTITKNVLSRFLSPDPFNPPPTP